MGRSANQKRKILLIERMLMEADEAHPIAMREILERLAQEGIQAERKSVYADLEELRAVGMEICFRKGKPSGYYPVYETGKCAQRSAQKNEAAEEMDGRLAEVQLQECRSAEEKSAGEKFAEEKSAGEKFAEEKSAGEKSEEEKSAEEKSAEEMFAGEKSIEEKSAEKQSAGEEAGRHEQEWQDGIRPWEQPEGEYREIQLRCKKSALPAVIRRYGESCRILKEDEKQALVAAAEIPGNFFYGWLVAQGAAVRPVKPKETVKEYRKLLKKILESYK